MATPPSTASSLPHRDGSYWVPLLSTLLLVAIAAKRVKTYVTAQDPYWYIGLAHSILGGGSDPAEFAHGLSYVSPGFPLLLAGCIRAFGVYAPYGLNPVLAMGFFVLYAELVRHLFPTRSSVLIVLPGTLLLLTAGYILNIHFLLYPFRGMSVYFLSILGIYLLYVRSGTPGRPRLDILAGSMFTLAISIREPAALAAGGAAAWILLEGGIRRPGSWQRLGCFLLPMIVGATIVGGVVLAQGRSVNHQLESWLDIVLTRDAPYVLDMSRTLAGYLAESLRLPGLILLAIGLWSSRRHRALLCFFGLPALGFFVFYSLYLPHYRYLLTVVVFLCPLICAGALHLVEILQLRIPRLQPAWTVSVLLIAMGAITVRAMEPWGHKVSHRQVDAFRQALDQLAPDGGAAFVDPSCRYLVDALVCYSDLDLLNPVRVHGELASGKRCFYFRPLDTNCFYEGYADGTLDAPGPPPDRALDFYARREPVTHPNGAPFVVPIANGHFAVEEVLPWDQWVVRQTLHLSGHEGNTLWFDFGERPPGTTVEIHLENRDGNVVATWPSVPARHIQGLHTATSETGIGPRIVEVRSDLPLPPRVLLRAIADGTAMNFYLGPHRSLSTHYWLHPPFPAARMTDPNIARLRPAGRLVLPVPFGSGHQAIDYLLGLETPSDMPDQVLHAGGPDGDTTRWPVTAGKSYAQVSILPPHARPRWATELELTGSGERVGGRVASISITVRAAAPPE